VLLTAKICWACRPIAARYVTECTADYPGGTTTTHNRLQDHLAASPTHPLPYTPPQSLPRHFHAAQPHHSTSTPFWHKSNKNLASLQIALSSVQTGKSLHSSHWTRESAAGVWENGSFWRHVHGDVIIVMLYSPGCCEFGVKYGGTVVMCIDYADMRACYERLPKQIAGRGRRSGDIRSYLFVLKYLFIR